MINFRPRPDVDTGGRIFQDQQGCAQVHPARHHHFLLVAAGQGADVDIDVLRPHVEQLHLLLAGRGFGAAAVELTTAYATYEQLDNTDPTNGGAAWTQSEMNGLQLDVQSAT